MILPAMVGGLIFPGKRVIFRDEFITDLSAPLSSPHTCEPGPGTWALTDTLSRMAISGSKLTGANAIANAAFDPQLLSVQSLAMEAGLAMLYKHTHIASNSRIYIGLTTAGGVNPNPGIRMVNTNIYVKGVGTNNKYFTDDASGETKMAAVYRSGGGAFWAFKTAAGTWKLMFMSHLPAYASAQNLIVAAESASYKMNISIDDLTMAVLGGPFASDFGLASARVSSAGSGTTITHASDGFVAAELTPSVGNTYDIMFRRQDDSNCWIARLDYSANYIRLIEKTAGVEVERASATTGTASATVWSFGVRVVADLIYAFAVKGNGTWYFANYTSSLYNARTSAKLGSFTANEFAAFPYAMPSDAVSELEKYIP